jgi:hypothetical protein
MLMTDVPTQGKKILAIVLPSMVEAENFSDHPRTMTLEMPYLEEYQTSHSGCQLCRNKQYA